MTWFTHVNRNTINANTKHGTTEPAVRFQEGRHGKATYCMEVEIDGPVRVRYSPHEPLLPCGARLVIESDAQPRVVK